VAVEAKERVADVLKYPFRACEERNIRQETCERYGVRCAVSTSDGITPIAYYFPSYNKKGKLVGFMKQDVTKDKAETGHWTAIGSVSISNKLFGQDVAEGLDRSKKSLICTEGQWDCLSVFQASKDRLVGTKYEGLEPHVVSIPLGTANASESILQNFSFVEQFGEFVCFFDNDHATPKEKSKGILKGEEAKEAVLSALVGTKVKLFELVVPLPHKDASDMLQADQGDALGRLLFDKKEYSPEKIIKSSDISLEELLQPKKEGVYVEDFPELMNKIHGFRTGELVVLASPSGCGKSTITSLFASRLREAGKKVGLMFLEETKHETFQRMLAHSLGINYLKFRDNPLKYATREEIEEAYNEIIESDSLVMMEHFGSLPVDELMGKIRYMHQVEGCDYIVLDHLSLLTSGLRVVDERREVDYAMTTLAAYCASHDVGILAVSHINRTAAEQFKPPKTKEGEEPKPYWVQVTKEMMRSSSALEQLSWIVLGLEPKVYPDRSRGEVRLTVLKNRPWGALGACDIFRLDDNTWDVILVEENEF